MLDNRAAGVFIASLPQVIILSKLDLIILVDSSTAGNYRIKFGARKVLFLGII
jgi:hypothetical protein